MKPKPTLRQRCNPPKWYFLLVVFWLLFYQAHAQQTAEQVSGIVLDETGEALVGVTVLARSEQSDFTTGTATDVDGKFSFSNLPAGGTYSFTFSYIGYESQTLTGQRIGTDGKLSLSIELEAGNNQLTEVVVVGYGTQKKINVTGAVSAIEAEALESRPVTNVSSGLQGLMAGVTVTNPSGPPGNNAGTIRIRGIGTLGDASPLVVIDGIPGGTLDILNPEDIESISVLKDAASSSIYGVRGANGVILVTTKKGRSATPSIAYNNYFGLQTPTALPRFLGSPEYMQLLNESQINVGRNPTYTDADIEIARNGSDPNYFANTNWIDEIYKPYAPQQNHNVSVNGGGENFNYYLSYGLLKEGGLITGDNYRSNRNNMRVRLNTTLVDRLQVDVNLGYIDRKYSGSSEGIGGAGGPIYAAHQILPLVPVRFTTGGWGYIGGQRNPVAVTTDGGTDDFASQEFTGNLSATLNLFKGFSLRGQYGLIRSNSKRTIFSKTINYYSPIDNSLIYQTNVPNKIDTRDYTNLYQTFIGIAQYERLFNELHDVRVMLGASQEENIGDNFVATRTNLATQEVGHLNLGTENQLNSGSASQNALQSLFGRVNYGFNNRYLAEVNFRYDGSTRFAPDVRWNLFTSASLGWAFSEESFFSGLKSIIDFGKLRISYGSQGNDRVGDFAYLDVLGPVGTMPIGNTNTIGYRYTSVPNSLLTWESVIKQNAGLDLTLLNGRLGVTADYFINETRDILLVVPLPDVLGTNSPPQNAGKVENKGWELALTWNDQLGDVRYGANFNISDVRNRVTDYGGVPPVLSDRIRKVGEPIDAFFGLVADRIAQVDDFTYDAENDEYIPNFPHIVSDPVAPGDLIYKDLDGDGEITLDDDRTVIGNAIPRYTFGFRGNAAWKGFDMSFFLQGVGKADGYLQGASRHALINEGSLPQKIHLDRWTPENPDASYPRLTYQQAHNQRLSTYWLEDASYLRLKNVQLGYTLPSALTQRVRISKLRIFASADNLLTLSDFFYGYDPETPVSSGGFYPQVKTFVMGLNLNFQ
jgi:TonB-linked SusC/RagA family outer membrane protein